MNDKKAKAIRSYLKHTCHIDVRETMYMAKKAVVIGIPPRTAIWTGQAQLQPECGRATYLKWKRGVK